LKIGGGFMKKISLLVLGSILALFPFNFVNAETFTYSVTVEQPVLSVSITSTVPETTQTLELDRSKPYVFLDTIRIENTGAVDSTIEGKVTVNRTDGGPAIGFIAGNPGNPTVINPSLYVPGTETYITGSATTSSLSNTFKDLFDVNAGQTKDMDFKIKVHPDFSASFDVTVEFNAKAK
jgi:hypothetical protein